MSEIDRIKDVFLFILRRGVLDQSNGIENIGVPQWKITLCLLCAWLMTFGALSRGVKSTGKVVCLKKSFSMKCVNILEILPVVKLCNSCISCKHHIITVNCILCRAFV